MAAESGGQPNVLLVVMDACRADYAREHASTFRQIADSNLTFEDAISPSPWSLPTHASMFNGLYPAEHGVHRADDSLGCPTAELLSERGYTCIGISANGFASQRTGFHESFDEFYYTGGRDPFVDGLDISGTAQRLMRDGDSSFGDALAHVLRAIPRHDHPLKSLVNLAAVSSGELAQRSELLQRIPHPWVAPGSGYCYDPSRNTDRVLEVLERDDGPFFIFVNYMDTHHPYKPRADIQRKHLGRSLSRRELREINETVAAPRKFLERMETEGISEDEIETVRGLYAGEVETVDEHLAQIRSGLERTGKSEDTLLVITSDHGENLGEVDEMGSQRMGHEGSVSDAVLSVPLILANPRLASRRIEGHVSLKNLHTLFLDEAPNLLSSGGEELGPLAPPDGPVWSHYPAVGGERLFEKYPEAPEEAIAYRVTVDTVVAYQGKWKVVASSNGEQWARNGDEVVAYEAVPEELRSACERQLSELEQAGREGEISSQNVSQLEALGYM